MAALHIQINIAALTGVAASGRKLTFEFPDFELIQRPLWRKRTFSPDLEAAPSSGYWQPVRMLTELYIEALLGHEALMDEWCPLWLIADKSV